MMIYTLKYDDIRLAAMIYQVCDLDKKILQKMYPFLQYFLVEMTGVEPVSKNQSIRLSSGGVVLVISQIKPKTTKTFIWYLLKF